MDKYSILISISLGGLIDRITILRIKKLHISDPAKLIHVEKDLTLLEEKLSSFSSSAELEALVESLYQANSRIWDAEEIIRAHWDDDMRALAASRLSHASNDERFRIKQKINTLVGSELSEVKSHQS